MTIPRLGFIAASALLSAGFVLAQDAPKSALIDLYTEPSSASSSSSEAAPAAPPVDAAPVAPVTPAPESIGDPFAAGGGGDAANIRLSAGLAKAAQSIKVVGVGKSTTGSTEAILRLPDKSVVHVRPGESFTFMFGTGLVLPCEVSTITDQEIGLIVNGQTELRLR